MLHTFYKSTSSIVLYVVYVGAASNLRQIEYYERPRHNSEMAQYPESQLMTFSLPLAIVHHIWH